MTMRIAVTGAAGFIGSAFLWQLNKEGISDILAVDVGEDKKNGPNIRDKRITGYIERDKFLELAVSDRLDRGIDMIVHLGACADTTEPDMDYLNRNNYLYSKELATWALKHNRLFFYASSAATYGAGELGYSDNDERIPLLKPLNAYGMSKHLFDMWILENKLAGKVVGFKFFNVYGPNEYHKQDMRSMVNKGYYQIKETGRLRLFKSYMPGYHDGGQKRDFIYIKDTLAIMWYFMNNPDKKGIFNVGTGHAHTWNELAIALFRALGIEPDIEYIEMPENIKDRYQYFTQADLSKLRSVGCGHTCIGIYDAVKDYVGYLKVGRHL
jgi:ADP-L-glycero-D-manno-heptose 6-epimerase